jgi:hypothetical protein
MALPTPFYTWVFDVNYLVSAAPTVEDQARNLLFGIKQLLTADLPPCFVRGSSNGVTAGMGGLDKWATSSDIVWSGKSGDPFSWIVIETDGTLPIQILIACDDKTYSGNGRIIVSVSPSVSFSGGSTTSVPTAPDSYTILEGTWFSETTTNHIIHKMIDNTGANFRLAIWRQSTNLCSLWVFDKFINPVPGFVYPRLSLIFGSSSGLCNAYSSLSSYSVTAPITGSKKAYRNSPMDIGLTGEGIGLSVPPTAITETGILAASSLSLNFNDINNEWPMFPIGVASMDLGNRGRHGNVADLYWRPSGVSPYATLLPASGPYTWVVMGDLILPWDGTSTPLIA